MSKSSYKTVDYSYLMNLTAFDIDSGIEDLIFTQFGRTLFQEIL